jgi:hypothetical protein
MQTKQVNLHPPRISQSLGQHKRARCTPEYQRRTRIQSFGVARMETCLVFAEDADSNSTFRAARTISVSDSDEKNKLHSSCLSDFIILVRSHAAQFRWSTSRHFGSCNSAIFVLWGSTPRYSTRAASVLHIQTAYAMNLMNQSQSVHMDDFY